MTRPDWSWTLDEALDDEYKARATYEAVITRFGPIRPFVNIKAAEERHAAALLVLYRRYGLQPIADRWRGRVASPATPLEACRAGLQAEIENAGLYDRLLAADVPPDVRQVFLNLRSASQERHLSAFQRCAGGAEASQPAAPPSATYGQPAWPVRAVPAAASATPAAFPSTWGGVTAQVAGRGSIGFRQGGGNGWCGGRGARARGGH